MAHIGEKCALTAIRTDGLVPCLCQFAGAFVDAVGSTDANGIFSTRFSSTRAQAKVVSGTNDDVAGSGQTWHTNGVASLTDRSIPPSYYLKQAPVTFGMLTWPPYDPAKPAANSFTNIPAGFRYAFGTNPPAASK